MAGMKKVALTMQQRLNVLKELETSSVATVAKRYNIHQATVRRIKRKAPEITEFGAQDSGAKQRRRIKKPMYEELEKRLLTWFIERRTIGAYVSDMLLLEKAVELKDEIGVSSQFKASRGWLAKFKRRNKIRLVRVYREKASADEDGVRQFVTDLHTFMKEQDINPENVYNMDETGLLWKALPMRTLIGETEESVSRHKIEMERLTLGLCTNSTGTHKLMPLLIHKYKHPKALKHCMDRLPVIFRADANAWMSQVLFIDWFENCFKKSVQKYQLEKGLHGKVILLIDNCVSHTLPVDHVQDDNFIIKYLPPNATSLIQPMDQGIIEKLKRSFRHKLAQKLLINGGGIEEFYKQYTIKHCIEMINEAWGEITYNNIKNAWNKIIIITQNIKEEEEEEEERNIIVEMQQILTRILKQNITSEEIEEYFSICSEEERISPGEIKHTVECMDEETVENQEEEEEGEEEENQGSGTQEQGIHVNRGERKELEDIFKRLESYKNRIPRSTWLLTEALKVSFLGETNSNI